MEAVTVVKRTGTEKTDYNYVEKLMGYFISELALFTAVLISP